MKKLPNGISDYERLVDQNYYYVDKTKYIEQMENLTDPYIMFLRPRKFGKTLFTSVLENYYDIKKVAKFEKLYGETYIGKNPTTLKNSYHVLRFNFSGIDTSTVESTINGFKNEVASSIEVFIKKYELDFYVNWEDEAEVILNNLLKSFRIQKESEKIYVIIDEYDHFANELLGFSPEQFKALVAKNGKVRKWYEILKKGTESVVDRIFITGVAPITLDSMTSGFNISKDKTRDGQFNEMMGFTKEELIELMDAQNISKELQEKLLPIMKENYDGYKFSLRAKEKIYNSNMCLYFLNEFLLYNEVPKVLVDVNIASDYSKLGKLLNLCKTDRKIEIIQKTVLREGMASELTEKFNPEIEFTEEDFVSLLFYLGYLTIIDEEFGILKFGIPNKVMKEIYTDYFLKLVSQETDFRVSAVDYMKIQEEIAMDCRIDKLLEILQKYLNNLSNRDFIKFDEKYVKLIVYCIGMNLKGFRIKSEMEVERNYPDLLIIPKEIEKNYGSVMIEFKYLKKEEANLLESRQKEARIQIEKYAQLDEIKNMEKLAKYTVVAVNDKIYVEKI